MLVLISVVDYKFMTLFELWFMDGTVSNPSNFILYHAPFLLLFVDFKIFYDSCPCRCTVGKIIKDVMLFRIKLSFYHEVSIAIILGISSQVNYHTSII